MAIQTKNIVQNEKDKFKESTSTAGQPGVVVVNPDGSNVGSSIGTSAGDLGKAEDAAHSSGDTGVFVLAVRKDTAAALATTNGDYTGLIVDSTNHLYTKEGFAAVAEDNDAGVIKVEERYSTVVIEANATTTHVTGAGYLLGFVITAVGATSNVLDIYDNTAGSGTKMISQVDTTQTQAVNFFPVKRAFTTGLTTVLATGTAAKLYLIYQDRSA